jgi:hypothetical protein
MLSTAFPHGRGLGRDFYSATDGFFDHGQIARGPEVQYSTVMSMVGKGFRRLARGAALALALVATSLLLLQPICAAAEVPATSLERAALPDQAKHAVEVQDGAVEDLCCPVLGAAPVASSMNPPSSKVQPLLLPPQPAFAVPAHGKRYARKARLAVVSLSPIPRYHARSARIQR